MTKKAPRTKRSAVERKAPVRSRTSSRADRNNAEPTENAAGSKKTSPVAERAIETAYQVMEAYLDAGRRAAQGMSRAVDASAWPGGWPGAWRGTGPASTTSAGPTNPAAWSEELFAPWLQLAQNFAQSPWLRPARTAPTQGDGHASTTETRQHALRLTVDSTRPVQTAVDLDRSPTGEVWLKELQSQAASTAPPIRSVEVGQGPKGVELRIHVPVDQPPGVYVGEMRDSQHVFGRVVLSLS